MLTDVSNELGKLLIDTVNKAAKSPNLYKIKANIKHKGSSWNVDLLQIEGLNIIQDFNGNYADMSMLHALMHPVKVVEMIEYAQELSCTIVMTKHHWSTFLPLEDGVIIKQYRAIIANLEDISKSLNIREYKRFESKHGHSTIQAQDISARVPISIQLLDESVYAKRHQKITTTFNIDTTIELAINWILNVFKIGVVDMKPIDNKMKFVNLKIPPVHGLDSVFEYLQNNYGIYSKGFSHYHFDDISYIWRPYDHAAKSKTVIKLYAAPIMAFDNNNGYHYVQGKDTHIVTIDKVNLESPILQGSENLGTTMTMHNSDMVIAEFNDKPDDFRLVDNQGRVFTNQTATTYLSNSKSSLHKKRANNVDHRTNGSNPFLLASELASYQGVTYTCRWRMSVPYTFYPAQSVILHYDDKDGVFVTQRGILSAISYQSIKVEDRVHADNFFAFDSVMQFWLQPDPIS